MPSCYLCSSLPIICLTHFIVHQAARVQHSAHSDDLVSVTRDASIQHTHNMSSLVEATTNPDDQFESITTTEQLSFTKGATVEHAQNISSEVGERTFKDVTQISIPRQPSSIANRSTRPSDLEATTIQMPKTLGLMIDNSLGIFALALIVCLMCFPMAWEVPEEGIDSDSENARGFFMLFVNASKKTCVSWLCCCHRNRRFSRSCAGALLAIYKSKAEPPGSFETDTDPPSSLRWHVDLPHS